MRVGAAEVIVEGRVQGVGFRNFAQRRAQDRQLTGYAINLQTGHVKICVEGSAESIAGYVRDLEQGPPLARITRVAVTAIPYTGRYHDFRVRFTEAG